MIFTTKRTVTGFLLLIAAIMLDHQLDLRGRIRASYVEANVPDQNLEGLLNRDLLAHFAHLLERQDLVLEAKLLRKAPTQAGTSLPKFYAWITVKDRSGKILRQGAARVAAVEKERFEITDFLSAEGIRSNP